MANRPRPTALARAGITALAHAAIGAASLLAGCADPEEAPPSIAVVTIDTLRRDRVGIYGGPAGTTPALDALAAQGLVHDAAWTTMPTTGPAHLSLFTGLLPSQHGGRRNGDPLASEHAARDVARILHERGFATAAFVTTRILGRTDTGLRGFEIFDAPRDVIRDGESAVSGALAWLDVEPHRPVFLWVHIYDPHSPYGIPEDKRHRLPVDRSRYGFVDPGHYDEPSERREMEARYAAGVSSADTALGRLVRGLRERLGDPLIVVTADHGEHLSEHLDTRGFGYDHGEFLDAEAVAIPLVLAGPGVETGRSAGTASIRDLYTSILEAAGVGDPDAEREGRRDLRLRSDAARSVLIERRIFRGEPRPVVRAHAVAAASGSQLVIVGEDGAVLRDGGAPPPELTRIARAHLEGLAPPAGAASISEATRRALEALGYAE